VASLARSRASPGALAPQVVLEREQLGLLAGQVALDDVLAVLEHVDALGHLRDVGGEHALLGLQAVDLVLVLEIFAWMCSAFPASATRGRAAHRARGEKTSRVRRTRRERTGAGV